MAKYTMAEFDCGGLSAVSAFFNASGKQKDTESSIITSAPTNVCGRQGVGSAATKQVTISSSSDNTIGGVLKVGKRKRREAEDELDDQSTTSLVESDEDNGEEEGRTAIAEKLAKTTADLVTAVNQLTKKKGKKERQAKEQASKASLVEEDVAPTEGDATVVAAEDDDKDEAEKVKRKRRKVRSRQKNIYKDKRMSQHKPRHLVPGRQEFKGRPLTAETRAKLNLAPSRSSKQRNYSEDMGVVKGTKEQSSSSEGVKLAIDHLLDHGEEQLVDSGKIDMLPIDHVKKKKKKSKYKNLRVAL